MTPHSKWIRLSFVSSVVLLGLCVVLGLLLYRQQASVAGVLHENIVSGRADSDLVEALVDLKVLLGDRAERLSGLHDRIELHLTSVIDSADVEEERVLADRVVVSYRKYCGRRDELPPTGSPDRPAAVRALIDILERETTPACQQLVEYNAARIEASSVEHQLVIRSLAVGMAGIGVLGTVAGTLLGYAAARGVRSSIQRLQVQVRDAAGKLGGPSSEIVVTRAGDLGELHAQMGQLLGQVEGVVETMQRQERDILRAEQLAAVGQLAAGVAHEIRNPLTAIKMLVQVARSAGETLPPEDLAVIETEVRRMERSLQSFLDYARPVKPCRRDTDLVAVIDRTLELVRGRATQQKVTVRFDRPAGPTPAIADAEQLKQVFVNLTMNALDAMPTGGELRVRMAARPGGLWLFEVTDTGPGVAPQLADKLFQPFASGKETGLGLGLVLSRRIVEDHGGTLTLANRAAGGAAALVTLPGRPPAPPAAPASTTDRILHRTA